MFIRAHLGASENNKYKIILTLYKMSVLPTKVPLNVTAKLPKNRLSTLGALRGGALIHG